MDLVYVLTAASFSTQTLLEYTAKSDAKNGLDVEETKLELTKVVFPCRKWQKIYQVCHMKSS